MVEWYECGIISAPDGGYEVVVRAYNEMMTHRLTYIRAFSSGHAGLEEALDDLNKQIEEYIK